MNASDILDALFPGPRPTVSRPPDQDPERADSNFAEELERGSRRAERHEGQTTTSEPDQRAGNTRAAMADADGAAPRDEDAAEPHEGRRADDVERFAESHSEDRGASDDSPAVGAEVGATMGATMGDKVGEEGPVAATEPQAHDQAGAMESGAEAPIQAAGGEAVPVALTVATRNGAPAPELAGAILPTPAAAPTTGEAAPNLSPAAPKVVAATPIAAAAAPPRVEGMAPRILSLDARSVETQPGQAQPAHQSATSAPVTAQPGQPAPVATPLEVAPGVAPVRLAQPNQAIPVAAEAPSPTQETAAPTPPAVTPPTIVASEGDNQNRRQSQGTLPQPQQQDAGAAVAATTVSQSPVAAAAESVQAGTRYKDLRAPNTGLRARADGPSRPSPAVVVESSRPLFLSKVRVATASAGANGASRPLVTPATLVATTSLKGGGVAIVPPTPFEATPAAATAKPAPAAALATSGLRLPLQAGGGAPLPEMPSPLPGGGTLTPFAVLTGPDKAAQFASTATRGTQAKAVPTAPGQVAVNITRALASGLDRIVIRLQPANLGRVEVKLEVATDGRATVAVVVEKQETLELLQRDARSLERALEQAGLRTGSDSLSFNLRGQNGDWREAAKEPGGATEQDLDEALDESDDGLEQMLAAAPGTAYGADSQTLDIQV